LIHSLYSNHFKDFTSIVRFSVKKVKTKKRRGQISQAPLFKTLLRLVGCQGCEAPLCGYALDAPQSSAILLAGGLRDKTISGIIPFFSIYTKNKP